MVVPSRNKRSTGFLKSIRSKLKEAKKFLANKEDAKRIITDYLNNILKKENTVQKVTNVEVYYLSNRLKISLTDGCNTFYKNFHLFHLVTNIIDKTDLKQKELHQKIDEIKNYILYARLSALNNLNIEIDNKLAVIWKEIKDIEEEMNCDKYDAKIIKDTEEDKLNNIYMKLKNIISLDNVLWNLKQRIEINKHKLSKEEIEKRNSVKAALLNIDHQTTFLLKIYDSVENSKNKLDTDSLKEKVSHLLEAINISISLVNGGKEKA